LYKRLGRPQGRSGRVRKISPSPGFHHRTFQPVASRYTDYDRSVPTTTTTILLLLLLLLLLIIIIIIIAIVVVVNHLTLNGHLVVVPHR
jgi:hypothetical protein